MNSTSSEASAQKTESERIKTESERIKRVFDESYSVRTFNDGPQMLEVLEHAGPPDVLIVDWQLHRMTGLEVCQFLWANKLIAPLPKRL